MLGCYLYPKNYYALRCIFGGKEREHLLRHFLNSMLHLEGECAMTHIHINGCHNTPAFEDLAERILTIHYRDQAGRECVKQIRECRYLQDFILSLLQLPAFDKRQDQLETPADKWSYFFKHAGQTYIRDIPAVLQEPYLEEAFGVLEEIGRSEDHMAFYNKAEMDRMDCIAEIGKGYEEGVEKGMEKGRKEGRQEEKFQIARKMRALGLDGEAIMQMTGLTHEDLETLD